MVPCCLKRSVEYENKTKQHSVDLFLCIYHFLSLYEKQMLLIFKTDMIYTAVMNSLGFFFSQLGKSSSGDGAVGHRWKTCWGWKPNHKTSEKYGQHYEGKGTRIHPWMFFFCFNTYFRKACFDNWWFLHFTFFSLETWTLAAQNSFCKRSASNSFTWAMKLSAG